MAVAAADFYSYAKATGTPLPKSKQEEAQLAPAVNRWKKSRLKAPERERDSGDLGNVLGGGAIAAGLAGAALYGYRRGWGDSPASRKPAPTGPNLPNVDNVTGLSDTTFIQSPITKEDSRGVNLKGTKNKKTGTYQASVYGIQKEPQVTSQQALDDYKKHYINEKSTGSRSDIASLQEGIRQKKLASGDREISRGYFESDAKRQEQELARRGFNETDLPELEDQPAPGTPSPDDPASYSPRAYIESTGAVEPSTNQFSRKQLTELNEYASSVADYDGNPDFIRINDKLDDYLEGRTNVYPLTKQDVEKFDNSLTNLNKIDPGAFDRELDILHSDVGVNLGRRPSEYTRKDVDLEDKRLYEIETQGFSNIKQPEIFSNDPNLNPKGYKYDSQEGVYQVIPAKEQTFLQEQKTLVEQQQQPNVTTQLADQSLESANSGYQQMADPIERSVQRNTDSVAIGNKAAQVEALQQELLVGQRSNLGPKPVTTQTRQDEFYTSPRRLSSEAKQYARTGDIGSFTGKAFGGSRLAGATNVPVQRGTPAGGQLQLPIVYSTQDKINPALRTQLVNEGPTYYSKPGEFQRVNTDPTYTSVDEYLARFEPVKEEIIESPLEKDLIEARAMAELSQREKQLLEGGLRPVTKGGQPTVRFQNALAAGWSAKPNIKQTITDEAFRENVVLPKFVEDYISTKIPETDASNIARDYYNPDTGNIQYPDVKGDAPITRDIYKEKVIDNEELKNAASGTSIRGTSRSLDIQEPKVRTRTDEFTGDVRPDRIGGTLPTGGVPVEIDGQPAIISGPSKIEEANLRDAGLYPKVLDKTQYPNPQMAPQLSKQEVVQSIINPSSVSREDLTGGGAGMGVYGRQLGYVPGPTSKTAGTRPTQLPEGKYGEFNPTTQRDEFRDLSNNTLKNIIERGTYRSGKMGRTAKEAQQELTLRQNLNYPENYTPTKQTTLDAMKVSDDIRRIYSSGRPDAQQQVDLYLKAQGAPQRTSTSFVVNEDVDLRGTPVRLGEQPVETSVTQTYVGPRLNYPAAQNQVTYVPPTESTIRSLPVTPSELEKAERMHLLNYISAAHGQIKGGARAGGTKMRNNLTPYQEPSDAMINQLIMKRRMERI